MTRRDLTLSLNFTHEPLSQWARVRFLPIFFAMREQDRVFRKCSPNVTLSAGYCLRNTVVAEFFHRCLQQKKLLVWNGI